MQVPINEYDDDYGYKSPASHGQLNTNYLYDTTYHQLNTNYLYETTYAVDRNTISATPDDAPETSFVLAWTGLETDASWVLNASDRYGRARGVEAVASLSR